MSIFTYGFMQRAFICALCISVIAPCIGQVIVLKRLSAIGDATSHTALAGIAFGLAFGVNPVLGAVMFSVFAVLSIEGFRKLFGKYAEISTTVVMSAGVGLTAIFLGFVKGSSANLNSFLFGSIVAITDFELYITVGLSVLVLIVSLLLYKELFAITFDEEAARLSGVPVEEINLIFMLLTAVTVSVSARAVGALMISSMLVIPVATAMMISKSYRQNMILSVIFALLFTVAGLLFAFYFDLKPGGTIVLTGVFVLLITVIIKRRR